MSRERYKASRPPRSGSFTPRSMAPGCQKAWYYSTLPLKTMECFANIKRLLSVYPKHLSINNIVSQFYHVLPSCTHPLEHVQCCIFMNSKRERALRDTSKHCFFRPVRERERRDTSKHCKIWTLSKSSWNILQV